MRADTPVITQLIIPSNAGPGQPRIEIKGSTITGYYADGNIAWQATVTPSATITSYSDDVPSLRQAASLESGAFMLSGAGDPNITHSAVFLNTGSSGNLFITLVDAAGVNTSMQIEATTFGAAALISGFEIWNTPIAATNWALGDTGGSFGAFQYRKDGLDNIKCLGAIHMTLAAGLASGTYSFLSSSVPVKYRPAKNWRFGTAEHTSSANVAKAQALISLTPGGVFQIATGSAIAQNDNFYIYGEFPLGNIS